MDESRKKILSLCAAFIAAPRLMFLDEESPAALRDALADSIRKAEILLRQVDACYPNIRVAGNAREEPSLSNLI
jgi:ABC-type uncharacterized transport system YnjBCD ATPase subunit